MKKGIMRMLAFLLALAMCVSTTGVAAYAEGIVVTNKVSTEHTSMNNQFHGQMQKNPLTMNKVVEYLAE